MKQDPEVINSSAVVAEESSESLVSSMEKSSEQPVEDEDVSPQGPSLEEIFATFNALGETDTSGHISKLPLGPEVVSWINSPEHVVEFLNSFRRINRDFKNLNRILEQAEDENCLLMAEFFKNADDCRIVAIQARLLSDAEVLEKMISPMSENAYELIKNWLHPENNKIRFRLPTISNCLLQIWPSGTTVQTRYGLGILKGFTEDKAIIRITAGRITEDLTNLERVETESIRVWNLPHRYNLKNVMEFLGILDLPPSWKGKRSFAFPMEKEKAEAFVKRYNSQVYENTFIGLRFSA